MPDAIGGAMTWQGSRSRWIYGLTGVVSILFGAVLLWRPLAGALALIWTLGVYAIVFGVMMVALGIHVRGVQRRLRRLRPLQISLRLPDVLLRRPRTGVGSRQLRC